MYEVRQPFRPFELEQYQSRHERTVAFNLADSGVKSAALGEWLNGEEMESVLRVDLGYPEVNGSRTLRQAVAALYPAAKANNVLVTIGGAQANSLVCSTLLSEGDEVVVCSPTYRQVAGLAANLGCTVKELETKPSEDWRVEPGRLERCITRRTKLVSIVNPNNPTGTVLTQGEMAYVVKACSEVGAWLLADEVYRESEYSRKPSVHSFWGSYDRLVCTGSLSKAYGLAGLRIGWALAPRGMIDQLWRRHEYNAIAASSLSMKLAEMALLPSKRQRLLERARSSCDLGWSILERWLAVEGEGFSASRPQATSVVLVQQHFGMTSYKLAEVLRRRANVLVAPGRCFGVEGYIRLSVGYEGRELQAALTRISDCIRELKTIQPDLSVRAK